MFFCEYVKQSALSYLADLAQYAVFTAVETAVIYPLTKQIYSGSFISFVVVALAAATLTLTVNLLLYCRSWKMRSVCGLIRQSIRHEA